MLSCMEQHVGDYSLVLWDCLSMLHDYPSMDYPSKFQMIQCCCESIITLFFSVMIFSPGVLRLSLNCIIFPSDVARLSLDAMQLSINVTMLFHYVWDYSLLKLSLDIIIIYSGLQMCTVQLWYVPDWIRGKVEVFRLLQEVLGEQGGSMVNSI